MRPPGFVQTWECAAGVPPIGRLVLYHGTHEHGGRYAPLAAALTVRGIEVHALDFHGHGRSAGARGDTGSAEELVGEAIGFATSVQARAPPLPTALFGHSLGAMACFMTAHALSARGQPADCVVLSGFAMDSEAPPLGLQSLTPVLRVWDGKLVLGVLAVLARTLPLMDAFPLDQAALTSDDEQRRRLRDDPLHYHGWVRNRAALCILRLRSQCRERLAQWAPDFPFLLVHGEEDTICPRSAADSLLAASPSRDKRLVVYPRLKHEVLFEAPQGRAQATADIVGFVETRLAAARSRPRRSRL